MSPQDLLLAVFLFGGHVLSGVLGLALLYPYYSFLPRRYLLSLALLVTPASFGLLNVFDLVFSGQLLLAALPSLLSAALVIAFVLGVARSGEKVVRRALIAGALLIPIAWGHFITVMFAHSCFMGACA